MKGQLNRQSNQRGAVLIVALIMLLLTTFIGFSTMETSNLESKMATARDVKEMTFQTAETSIERGLLDQALISDALVAGLASTAWPTRDYTFSEYLTSSVQVIYLGDFLTEGYSAKKGDSGLSMSTLYYTVIAEAERNNTNIASRHTQGVYVLQPTAN